MGKPSALDSFTNLLRKITDPIAYWFHRFAMLLIALMSIPIFLDVVIRFFTDRALPGVIEIEEFMLVCIVFFATSLMQKQKRHISIDILVARLPGWGQKVVESSVFLISFVIFMLMSWQLVHHGLDKTGEGSFFWGIPISIFIFISAIGTGLLSIVLIEDFLNTCSLLLKDGRWKWIFVSIAFSILLLALPETIIRMPWDPQGLTLGLMGMALLFFLILIKMPIAYAMATVGFLGMWMLTGKVDVSLCLLGLRPYAEVANFVLCVAPLFILMGVLAFHSGMSEDLFDTAYKWFGSLPGGLSIASIAGCAGFAAVCGDSLATAATMGRVALPEMQKKNYSPSLATGGIAAGGTLGILIPPSVGFIFYALITEESIGKLFIAGILPGLLLTCLFILCIYIWARINLEVAPRGETTTFLEKLRSLKGVIAMLSLFFVILGGILAGIFSPNEGGAIGAVGSFFYALYRGRINRNVLKKATEETANITGMLIMILVGVGILGSFLAMSRLPFELAEAITGMAMNRYIVLAAIVILYLVLGCVLNVIPIILLTLPAIYPTVLALGFDPIWFGVISVILMEMGQITPPIGIIVFTVSSVARDVPMETIFQGIIPFLVCMIVCVIILTIFPQIATFLPNLLFS